MKDINSIKKELLKERGTENFHLALKELDPEDSRKVVESLNPNEIFIKVNHRTAEEDYICEYIDYLWDLSKKAFWRHVYIALDEDIGILWGDDMLYFEKMCSNLIPKKILYKHIDLVASKKLDSSNPYKQDLEAVGCVLRAQKKNFNRWKTIKKYVKANYTNHEDLLKEIKTLTKTKCSYHFGD